MNVRTAVSVLQNVAAIHRESGPLQDAVEMAVAALVEHETRAVKGPGDRPVVTTLCGSTRFPDAFALAMMHLTLKGHVVLTVGMCAHADTPVGSKFLANDGDESTPEKQALDQLHFRKIEMSDGIYVVNPGDYVGSSTLREVQHAISLGKTVEWMFPTKKVHWHD